MSNARVTLGDLVQSGALRLGDGYRTRQPEHGYPGFPILRVAEVLDGRVIPKNEDHVRAEFRSSIGPKLAQPGDVILTTKGTVGRVAIMPDSSEQFVYSPQLCYFRATVDGPLSSRYLYYWFQGKEFKDQASTRKGQTDMADYLNLADIRSLVITLPPLKLQQELVGVLGALDDKIAADEAVSSSCLNLSAARYMHASQVALWEDRPLKEVGTWHSGGTPSTNNSEYWGGDIPWISALSLRSPWIRKSDRRLTRLGARNGTRLVPRGAILFVVRGSSLKSEFRLGVTQREVAFGQDCKAIIPADDVDSDLLFHAINARRVDILDMVDETSIGAGRLATELIENLSVRLPTEPNNRVAEEIRNLNSVAALKVLESETLSKLKDALLPKLMSGEIRVRDAEKIVEDVT